MTVTMRTFLSCNAPEFVQNVARLAEAIQKKKLLERNEIGDLIEANILKFSSSKTCLDVAHDLHAIQKRAVTLGVATALKPQLQLITALYEKILMEVAPPIECLPNEVLTHIFSYVDLTDMGRHREVSTRWRDVHASWAGHIIIQMNEGKGRVVDLIRGAKSAADVISWLSSTGKGDQVTRLNFEELEDMQNPDLKLLVHTCPNLVHLSIPGAKVTGDGLDILRDLRQLQSLDLEYCVQLGPNSLKVLEFIPNLRRLRLAACTSLAPDCLVHLEHCPELEELDISSCSQLSPYSLDGLAATQKLRVLNAYGCSFESDALSNLQHVPQLETLNLWNHRELGPNCLDNLQYTPLLKELNVGFCIGIQSLAGLRHVPKLRNLVIENCVSLDHESIKYVEQLELETLEC